MQTEDSFHYTGTAALEVLKDAANYNRFLENLLAEFMEGAAGPVLDFGAGIGEFAGRLKHRGATVHCLEPDPSQRTRLAAEGFTTFADLHQIKTPYQRIYSLNVLEHIEDDVAALRDLHTHLTQDGKLLIYVPAFQILYSPFDKAVGHFRRYRREELIEKMTAAGLNVTRAEYVDSLGFFAWWVMKHCSSPKGGLNPKAVILYDRAIFPLSRLCDRFLGLLLGKNLLVVAEK